jgi:hypothetical protein
MSKFDPEKRVELKWCWDSETGEKFLIDMGNGKVIARGKDLKDAALNETQLVKDAKVWREGFDEGYGAAEEDLWTIIYDLKDSLAFVTEERDYLLKLSNPSEYDEGGHC